MTIVYVILAGVIIWIGVKVADLADRLHGAERDNVTLAQQVRELGGTPRATVSPGPTGRPGRTGSSGAPGSTGRPGATGKAGKSGPSGDTGTPGTPGVAGSPGAVGPSGPPGPAGKDGQDGQDGKDGTAGEQGPAGPPPSSWTFTYLGIPYTCTPASDGSTDYTCSP
jgi:hypothetical protein